jgi:transmembrane sensor
MSKQNFYTLLKRYRNGESSDQENLLVEQWFALLDKEPTELISSDYHALEKKLWRAINKERQYRKPDRKQSVYWRWAMVAATTVGAVLAGLFFTQNSSKDYYTATGKTINFSSDEMPFITVFSGNSDKVITLEDGSEITLTPQSSLEYPSTFNGNTREVYLTGKAFFKVIKDTEHPFLVYTGAVVTKVLGTSFWIDGKNPRKNIEVSVVTGKVTVCDRSENPENTNNPIKGGVILTANQKVKFSDRSKLFELGLVDLPEVIEFNDNDLKDEDIFVFDAVPMTEVIDQLERAYGIDIILENGALGGCLFRGDITSQPLFRKLDLLCSAGNAFYEVRGTRILVKGEPCNSPTPE